MLILLYNETIEYSTKNANSKDTNKLRDNDFVLKRQKLSDILGYNTSSRNHDVQSLHSL
jgi:hypothetical protein